MQIITIAITQNNNTGPLEKFFWRPSFDKFQNVKSNFKAGYLLFTVWPSQIFNVFLAAQRS